MWTPDQTAAILQRPRHTVVFAAPGSGKTTVLHQHIVHTVSSKQVHPSAVMALTFTRQAAVELKHRLTLSGALTQTQIEAIQVGTFHGAMFRLLLTGQANIPVLLNTTDQYRLMRQLADHEGVSRPADIRMLLQLNTWRKAHWPVLPVTGKLGRVLSAYERWKTKRHRWDYDDILVAAVSSMDNAIPQLVLQYLLVDEFQDTNPIQWLIIQRLQHAFDCPVYVVGDDDQAIYGFRAASPSPLLEFQQIFTSASQHQLTVNFRSDQDIVRRAGLLISHNRHRVGKASVPNSSEWGECTVQGHRNEWAEANHVAMTITADDAANGRSTTAILARTRNQLLLSQLAVERCGLQSRVHFRTYHDAKGKEWDTVHLVGAIDTNPYLAASRAHDADVASDTEEERRLFYVAMTRARHKLHVHCPARARDVKVARSPYTDEAGFEPLPVDSSIFTKCKRTLLSASKLPHSR